MKVFISSLNVPIGYATPPFPSLYWPLGPEKANFQASFLYYSADMWRFIVWWSMLTFGGLYLITGTLAGLIQLRNRYRQCKIDKTSILEALGIVVFYVFVGLFQGFVGGCIVGLLLSGIYKAGALTMSTWIPFCWAIISVLFDVCSSYSLSSVIL
ncbi:hypothetical protein CAAN1_15S01816 [[Candida] anglica]|uniref:Uncharacterized protein n=1 Tax=[Candida] anglica TaxID=148631 RepID=A0ABP0E802_9ASCO